MGAYWPGDDSRYMCSRTGTPEDAPGRMRNVAGVSNTCSRQRRISRSFRSTPRGRGHLGASLPRCALRAANLPLDLRAVTQISGAISGAYRRWVLPVTLRGAVSPSSRRLYQSGRRSNRLIEQI